MIPESQVCADRSVGAGCKFNFSLLVQREVARETTLRRGRFRFLPLLRTTLFETTQRGAAAPLWILPGERIRSAVPDLRFRHKQRRERKRSPPRKQGQTGFPLEDNSHPGWAVARTEYRKLSRVSRAAPFSFFHRARRCLSFRARPKRKIGGRITQVAFRDLLEIIENNTIHRCRRIVFSRRRRRGRGIRDLRPESHPRGRTASARRFGVDFFLILWHNGKNEKTEGESLL